MDAKAELQDILQQYREIEKKLERLNQQKQTMRERIQELLTSLGQTWHHTALGDERIVITIKSRIDIRYDEEKLRNRLGEDYRLILQPDIKKIKKHLSELGPVFAPMIEKIGSPSRNVIQELITSGRLKKEDFSGAFEKNQRSVMYVKKQPLNQNPDRSLPY